MIEFIQEYIVSFDFLKACVLIGTLTGFIVMWLQIKQHIALWYFNIISASALGINFFATEIYAYAFFQIYYIVTSAYGIYSWRKGKQKSDDDMPIQRMKPRWWVLSLSAVIILVVVLNFVLQKTGSEIAFVDACITSASIVATFLLTKKVLEYWFFWIFADTLYVSTILFLGESTLYPTVILYSCYVITSIIGVFVWTKKYRQQQLNVE